MRHPVVPRGPWAVLFFMTYPFGATKKDLEKAFRLPDAPALREIQPREPAELSETELATLLFEHPGV
mgnify:FL=1|jgi:hypothetical protein